VYVDAGIPEVVEAYAELYADGTRNGFPCGENDLWIAATAKAANALLITCDRDFDWLHRRHIARVYIEQQSS
jgi:predicted nucleic acid-binding protein